MPGQPELSDTGLRSVRHEDRLPFLYAGGYHDPDTIRLAKLDDARLRGLIGTDDLHDAARLGQRYRFYGHGENVALPANHDLDARPRDPSRNTAASEAPFPLSKSMATR